MSYKYAMKWQDTPNGGAEQVITKDGHTMFVANIRADLQRKSFLEDENTALKKELKELRIEKFNMIATNLCEAWERDPWLLEMIDPKMKQQLIDFIK